MTLKTKLTKRFFTAIISVLLVLIHLVAFTSCAFDESVNNFRGGEILDEDMMSEIKNELLGTDTETESETEKGNGSSSAEKPNDSTESNAEGTKKDTEGTERNETESIDSSEDTAIIVYWTEGGSVWHASRDCHHIKDKEVISGTVADAKMSGHETGCKTCNKKSS